MNRDDRIAVCSRSFSKNLTLRNELQEKYENVTFNDEGQKLEGETLIEFLRGHDKAITALECVDEKILKELPELKVISKVGVGLDMIDMEAMRRYKKCLAWSGGTNSRAVSEWVISFAIAMLRHIPSAYRDVLSGKWKQQKGRYLSGRIIGIIGCNNIGQDLVKLLQPFDCKILVHDIQNYDDFFAKYNIQVVSLNELLKRSDIVTLHVPLNHSTRNLLSAERLALMKPESILINTARGGLVDESALKKMLKDGRLAAAAFDVFATEPPEDQGLLELPNFLVTPHIGGSTEEAIIAMGRAAIKGLDTNTLPDY